MNDYRIWFENIFADGIDIVELPVNPQDVTISYPGNPTQYDVEGVGEIVIPRRVKLATLSIESFFPRENVYQTVLNSGSNNTPEWYVNFFRQLQKSRRPFELTIVRGSDNLKSYDSDPNNPELIETTYFDTVMQAVLLDFSITDKGGEPGDVYYNMTLSEYKDAKPKTIAEIAAELRDEYGNITEQKLVQVVNRPQQTGAIVEKRTITICGKVFELPDISYEDWQLAKQEANQIDRIVTRVLPPQVSNIMHSIYVSGLGWVDKSSCKLVEDVGTVNSINRLITNNYD
jgi:hypothetical protein